MYVCTECGYEMQGHKDKCPNCETNSDSFIEKTWSVSIEDFEDSYPFEECESYDSEPDEYRNLFM